MSYECVGGGGWVCSEVEKVSSEEKKHCSLREVFYTDYSSNREHNFSHDKVNRCALKIQSWWRGITERSICKLIKFHAPWTKWVQFVVSESGIKIVNTFCKKEAELDSKAVWGSECFDIYRDKLTLGTTSDTTLTNLRLNVVHWKNNLLEIPSFIVDRPLYVKVVPNYPYKIGYFSSFSEKVRGIKMYKKLDGTITYLTDVRYTFQENYGINRDAIYLGYVGNRVRNFRGVFSEYVKCRKINKLRSFSRKKSSIEHNRSICKSMFDKWFWRNKFIEKDSLLLEKTFILWKIESNYYVV